MDKKTLSILTVALALAAASMGRTAYAATLSLAPSGGTFFAGRSFTVAVQVASPDQALNAVQGEISFPTKQLQVLSVSKEGSILDLWVQDPVFSDQNGTVNFAGIAVNPGYQGASTTVLTITFAANAAGSAPISFVSGSVLANDGKGTNILDAMEGAAFTILPSAPAAKAVAAASPPPDPFTITRVDTDPRNPRPVFTWAAIDPASGAVRYEAKIGGGDWFDPSILETASDTYVLPPQSPTAGRTLTVRAFDAAGRYRDESVIFDVLPPLPPQAVAACSFSRLWLSCGLWEFFAQWGWLVGVLAIALIVLAYALIYSLLRWRNAMQRELREFRSELESDLAKIKKDDGAEGALGETVGHIVNDVGEAIDRFDRNP